ncbi:MULTISPECIES: YfhD family protein [unclassified Paenibacillus]|uniref:YfhD family protein n=1 Tax=unclassified Paenibacillus TaxID=185978 RepID=UPI000956B4A3|nr:MULTISPECIES: YfhD family protein [unclassified Paenibacillus]ASS66866.1 YfhD family protein [Paenibacillus sp. RUD330]SIP92962.1 YfhD-like protein [Paenibacillus sp. RU4X]SIQ11544.1 YfhD-like protein [Paenibacillus sp. RU4T]
MANSKQRAQTGNKDLPLGKNEDVEFSRELADREDLEALQRAEEADRRAEQ